MSLLDAQDPMPRRWVEHARAGDVPALLALYDRDAVVEAFDDLLVGREELASRLRIVLRKLADARLGGPEGLRRCGRGLAFTTPVETAWAHFEVRHEMHVAGEAITSHAIGIASRAAPSPPTALTAAY